MALIKDGFFPGLPQIPFSMRESVWQIIEQLTEDTNLAPEQEEGRDLEEVLILSMDSIRGQAMDGVVRYACWVSSAPDNAEPPPPSSMFDKMPEVRTVLDRHLNLEYDHSLAVHSIYGSCFGILHFLDADWTKANLRKIFPIAEEVRAYRRVSWYAFLTVGEHYERVFDLLSDDYRWTLDQLGPTSTITDEELRNLGYHLLSAYVGGKTALSDPGSVINKFLDQAPSDARAHAINSLGINIGERGIQFGQDEITRIQALWLQRLEAHSAGTAPDELAGFGWWFLCSQFPDNWAIQQLLRTLELCPKIDAAHLVAKKLAALCPQWRVEAVRCIELMVESDEQAIWIYSFQEETSVILKSCFESQDPVVQQVAQNFINRMAARGHLVFRKLIPPNIML